MATYSKQQYKNQKDRIRKAYKDIQKAGYVFDRSFEDIIGERPKKSFTRATQRLMKITKDDLWRMAKKPDTGESGWKERTKRREEGSRKGGKESQRRKREKEKPKEPKEPEGPQPKPPKEPEEPPIGEDDGTMFYENLKRLLTENVPGKPMLNELMDLLDQLFNKLTPEQFSEWADDNGDELTAEIQTEIKYYHVPTIRDPAHKKAKSIFQEGFTKYDISKDEAKNDDTITDESGEVWMNTSNIDLDEDVFMSW